MIQEDLTVQTEETKENRREAGMKLGKKILFFLAIVYGVGCLWDESG